MKLKRLVAVALASLPVFGAGCAGGISHASGQGSASCAFVAHFHGHTYGGMNVKVAPIAGRRLGVARTPACDDTGGPGGVTPGQRLRVAQLPGVSPAVALVLLGQDDTLLVRDGVRPSELPAAVTRLVRAPACVAADGPLTISGTWLGILGSDGETELDMVPPYDVSLRVLRSSAPRYVRAALDVRVPARLGRPLTRHDVRTSLWKAGTIGATATCRDGRYIAERITAAPPA